MSKYVTLAVATAKTDDVKTAATKAEPILKAKLNAIISSQRAKVIELDANRTQLESEIKDARGLVTVNATLWLNSLMDIKLKRDQVVEELSAATELLVELEEELLLFD